ncbi:MAG: OprO/OprP family phosphate-selective porin [Planctomycetaceae bacterium]
MIPAGAKRFVVLIALLFGWQSSSRADEASIADLQRRLEAVEQQNAQLLEAIEHARVSGTQSATGGQAATPSDAEVPIYQPANVEYSTTPTAVPEASLNPLHLSASWHNGLELESADKAFKVHVGGRTQFDLGWYDADDELQFGPGGTGEFRDGVDFRRARFRIDGTMYESIEWAAEYDFANMVREGNSTFSTTAFTDLWWTFTNLPYVGNLRVGNMKDPIGFEHLVSSRFLPFIERSYNQDSFYGPFNNGFTPGAMLFNQIFDDRMTWWAGLFKPSTHPFSFNTGDGEWEAVGRVTILPWYEDEGRQVLHFGFSAKHADLDEGVIRFRARNSIRSGAIPAWPILADTRSGGIDIAGDDNNMLNGELAAVCGSWTLQSEYLLSYVTDASQNAIQDVGTVEYHGGYVQVLYFLTGEHDIYNRKTGVFDRVIPNQNFLPCGDCKPGGIGAWQVGVRYSHLDLNDKAIDGGKLDDLTVGLNWFLNPNMKIQANYTAAHRDSATRLSDGTVHSIGMRFAHDF